MESGKKENDVLLIGQPRQANVEILDPVLRGLDDPNLTGREKASVNTNSLKVKVKAKSFSDVLVNGKTSLKTPPVSDFCSFAQ